MKGSQAILSLLVIGLLPALARADLGTLRSSEEQGGYRITVFTSPALPRAGLVEVKVLVQQQGRAADVPVRVRAAQGDRRVEALASPATPFQVAMLELDRAGTWHFDVEIAESARVGFEVDVAEPMPSWLALAPWIGWPIVPILLFVVHQALVRRGGYGWPRLEERSSSSRG